MTSRWLACACAMLCTLAPACGDGDEDLGDVDPCAPQQAQGDGQCDQGLGAIWDGEQCVFIAGCDCVGPDCGSLFESLDTCTLNRRQCTNAGTPCSRDDACPDQGMCVDGACVWN